MKICVVPGTTSLIMTVFIKDSSSTLGACLSGLDSTKVSIAYDRDDDGNTGATVVSLSAGTRGTWSSGGFIEKDSTNAKGAYQLGVPNAVLASGAKAARIYIQDAGSNNVEQLTIEIQLGPVSAQLADAVTHGGTTAMLRLGSTTSTPAFYATNTNGDVVKFEATAGDGSGLHLKSFGSDSGSGLWAQGGFFGGAGITLDGSGMGMNIQGAADNIGLQISGGSNAEAIYVTGGVGGGNATGCYLKGAGNKPGLFVEGGSSGDGLRVWGLGSQPGAIFRGGPSGGPGFNIQGYSYGLGVFSLSNGDGIQISAAGSGRHGILTTGADGGAGFKSLGTGTGAGADFGGGTDGQGVFIHGGANDIGLEIAGGSVQGVGCYIYAIATGTNTPGLEVDGSNAAVYDVLLGGTGKLKGDLVGTTDGLTAAGLATLFTINSTKVYADAVAGSPVKEIASNAVGSGGPSAATIATAVWTDLLASSDFSTVASIGKLLKDDIDAAISSRSTYAGADTSGTTTLLARLTAPRATNLDNLDAAITSRLATASYTTPPTVGQVSTAIFTDLLASSDFSTASSFGKLVKDFLDVAVSSRLAAGSYTAPDNADILAIKAKTDNLPSDPADESLIIGATNAIVAILGTPVTSVSDDLAAVKADTATIVADTASITTVVTGSLAELPQATPPATPTLSEALMFLYMALRNKSTSTNDEATIYNDVGTIIAKSATSDDGTIFIRDQFVTGP